MTNRVKVFEMVALVDELPEVGLVRGQVGTIVESLANGTAFEVEFSDDNGQVYASLGLTPDQFLVLRHYPLAAQPVAA